MLSILLTGISLLAQQNRSIDNAVNLKSDDSVVFPSKIPFFSFQNSLLPPENMESFSTFNNGELNALDSMIFYQWNFLKNDWKQSKKSEYFYDENGKLKEVLLYIKDQILNSWILTEKSEYQYNLAGKVTQKLSFSFDTENNVWTPNQKRQSIYNDNNYLVEYYQFYWNNSTNLWKGSRKITYDYNEQNKLIQYKDYDWDQDLNDWRNYEKAIYTYSSVANEVEIRYYYLNNSLADWILDFKIIRTYNSKNLISEQISAIWLENLNEWAYWEKSVFSFDSLDNKIEEKIYELDSLSDGWIHLYSLMNDYIYGNNGKILQDSGYYYSGENQNWVILGLKKKNYAYDDHENMIEYIVCNREHTQGWVKEEKQQYYYSKHNVSTNNISGDGKSVVCFPNPAVDFINVNLTEDAKIQIFDLSGNLMLDCVQKNGSIEISKLPSGLYLLHIKTLKNNSTLKIVKL